MDRSEHLEWCKQRANECLERDDLQGAFASFQSDMMKHEETSNHSALESGSMLLNGGHLPSQNQMRSWIDGFN